MKNIVHQLKKKKKKPTYTTIRLLHHLLSIRQETLASLWFDFVLRHNCENLFYEGLLLQLYKLVIVKGFIENCLGHMMYLVDHK